MYRGYRYALYESLVDVNKEVRGLGAGVGNTAFSCEN